MPKTAGLWIIQGGLWCRGKGGLGYRPEARGLGLPQRGPRYHDGITLRFLQVMQRFLAPKRTLRPSYGLFYMCMEVPNIMGAGIPQSSGHINVSRIWASWGTDGESAWHRTREVGLCRVYAGSGVLG